MGNNPIPVVPIRRSPTPAEIERGNLDYLREKYAIGFITLEELETGLASVLSGGAINVPRADPTRRWDHERSEWIAV